jgi:hypothetical protein
MVSSGLTPQYTGLPLATNTSTTPAGLPLERTFEGILGTAYPISSSAPTAVGTYRVTTIPADHTIGGQEVVTMSIVPKPVTVTVTIADRRYDGTLSAPLTLGLVGAVVGDDVHVDASRVSGAFADPSAGVSKTVQITTQTGLLTGLDAANYAPVITQSATATIMPATQALSFTTTPPSPAAVGATYLPVVVSNRGLTPSLAIGEGDGDTCTLSSGTVTLLAPGACVLVASQDGTNDIEAAVAVEQSITVVLVQLPQTITVEGLQDTPLDGGPLALPALTSGNLPLTYAASPASVCTAAGTIISLHGLGTCTVIADQAGDSTHLPATATGTFAVTAISQSVTLPDLVDISIDASPLHLAGVSTSGLPLVYTAGPPNVCTVSDAVLTLMGEGTCTVVANQVGDATHSPASTSTTFVVLPVMLHLSLQLQAGQDIAGGWIVVSGDGLKPSSEVRVELDSTTMLVGSTDADGVFDATKEMPQGVSPGVHRIVVTGIRPDDRSITASKEFFVDWSGALGDVQTSGGYTPLTATRILDTRDTDAGMIAGTEFRVVVPAALVPADVSALVLNLTVTDAQRSGYITIYPCGFPRPLAAAINFTAGETKANLVDAMFRSDGPLCLWSNVDTDAVVDLQGFHSPSGNGRLVPRTAVRLVDTRPDDALVDHQVLQIPVIGDGRAAAGTTTATLNVAVDDPQRAGFLTVYPCGTDRPLASNLNFVRGQTVSNEVMVQPGTDGMVCVYTTAATHLVVDLDATYETSGVAHFTALMPGRLADTRLTTKVLAGEHVEWTVVGDGGAPAGTNAVSVNIAVSEPEGAGFLPVYPCKADMPLASNLNFADGQTISNHVTATIGANGKICVFTSRATNIVIDIEGIYRPA